MRGTDAVLIPFSLVWGGFALFVIPWGGGINGFPFSLFALVFKVVAVYIIAGRFVIDMFRRRSTTYALTNRSALIASNFFGSRTKIVSLQNCPEITVTGNDELGSIYFGSEPNLFNGSRTSAWTGVPTVPAFEWIPDARSVYERVLASRG